MKNILKRIDDEVCVSHLKIAELTNNKKDSIRDIITKYKNDFVEFGILSFESSQNAKGGKPSKTYYLNEQQATLLLTYLKNNNIVREFKKSLVREFYLIKSKHQHHVVIGYKSQLAQKNKKIRLLEDENEALLECESIALFNGVHKNTLGRKNQQLQNENQTLQANNHNLKLELNNIKKSIHYTSADVLKLVEKGLKYDRLNDDYCNLYQKYQDINSHLNKIKPLMQSIVNINNENQMQIEF